MPDNKFLTDNGLTTLLNQLKTKIATKSEVTALDNETSMYITGIDYDTNIAFDTSEIIAEEVGE